MEFREKILKHLEENGVIIERIEQQGTNKSVVFHIPQSDNEKIKELSESMEKEFDVAVAMSDSFGMNVVVVEDNNLE